MIWAWHKVVFIAFFPFPFSLISLESGYTLAFHLSLWWASYVICSFWSNGPKQLDENQFFKVGSILKKELVLNK